MKKYLSLILALVLTLALLAPVYAEITPKGEFPIVDEPYKLTVAVPVNPKVEDINTNRLTLWMEETSGIDLEIIELASTDAATQINMMMNSGDLPDIIMAYNFPYDALCSYADAGLLLPLEEYIEKYAVNLYDVIIPDLGDATLGYVTYDGHIWAMPSGGQLVTNLYSHYPLRYQASFLETLNMEVPRTLDDLYNFLVAIRDNDANGNGDPNDEIPMMGYAIKDGSSVVECAYRAIFSAYQYTDVNTFLKANEDGKVEFIANNDLFKEAMQFMRKLVEEKLLDPATFTQDSSVIGSRVMNAEAYPVGVYAVGYNSEFFDTTCEMYCDLMIGPNLEGPYGYKSTMVEPQAIRRSMVVTSACERPDIAVRFFDMLLSDEAAITIRVGFEGEQWKKAEEGVLGRDGTQAWFELLTTQEWVQPSTNVIWDTEDINHSNIMNHCAASSTTQKYPNPDMIQKWNLPEEVSNEQLPQLLMGMEEEMEYNELKGLIVSSVKEKLAMFVLGDLTIDEYDDFCKELDGMGVARYVELAQEAYDSLMGK